MKDKLVKPISEYEHHFARWALLNDWHQVEYREEYEKLTAWLEENEPQNWVTCTRENAKVGDKVRHALNTEHMRKIEFIKDDGDCIVRCCDSDTQKTSILETYEINIAEEKE